MTKYYLGMHICPYCSSLVNCTPCYICGKDIENIFIDEIEINDTEKKSMEVFGYEKESNKSNKNIRGR